MLQFMEEHWDRAKDRQRARTNESLVWTWKSQKT